MTIRKVYLEGEMGELFRKELNISADSFPEVFKCLKCNFEGFMPYLQKCHDNNIGFICEVAGKPIKHESELLLLYKEGDMIITPLPAGSKSGGAKLLAAVAITVMTAGMGAAAAAGTSFTGGLGLVFGSGGAFAAGLQAAVSAGGLAGVLATSALGVAVNLAMAGLQQTMAPDPSTDSQQDESYVFQGSKQNIAEGDPVPILYGELRVPGRTVSFHTRAEQTAFYNNNSRAVSSESGSNTYNEAVSQQAGGNSSAGNGGINYYLPEFISDPH